MNNIIHTSWQYALDILKPSEKHLEHGLELHKESLVWDAYGFAPYGCSDDCIRKLNKMIEEGASHYETENFREEMHSIGFINDVESFHEYKKAWDISGVNCIFQNAGEEGNSVERMIRRFARFTWLLDSQRDFFCRAVFPDDVLNAMNSGKKALYLSTNGVPLPTFVTNQEEMLMFIGTFFQLGCRMMHLTYNRQNLIGGGCGEESDSGLSDFGRAVVKEMNRFGIIPDVSHSGQKTSQDAAVFSNKPVVASHSGVMSVASHCRAKTDEVIKAIADSGGFVGIVAVPSLLKGSGEIDAMLNHIDYIVKKFGADYVAIATDKAYRMECKEKPVWKKARPRFAALWPPGSFLPQYQKESQISSLLWTNWPLFTVGLVQRGYSDDEIRKIIGQNVLRVAKASLSDLDINHLAACRTLCPKAAR